MKKLLLLLLLIVVRASFAQTDCATALSVCGNTNFEGLSLDGYGGQEISSCGSEEHNSLWLKLTVVATGTLAFDIIPESADINEDFDFFLFNYHTCDNFSQLRCSTTNPAAAGLTTNVTGLRDSDNDSFEGPGPDGNSFVRPVNVVAGQTLMLVIDRPFGNSNFSVVWTGTAEFNDSPTVAPLPPGVTTLDIMQCDTDGTPDGITLFNLTQNTSHIVGSQTDVTVDYYNSASDCLLGVNAIWDADAYYNVTSPETIYVRVTNASGCFVTSEFEIGINNEVGLTHDEYAICDTADDGNATNGQALFNLADVTQSILPGFIAQGFSVGYFLTEADAQTGTNPLGTGFYNTTPGQQTVYVKADAGLCSSVKPVKLIVRNFAAIPPATLVQCDYGNTDGISVFDLSQADASFTASDPNLSVEYFENAAALAADIPLSSVYSNTSNPQDVIVKITDSTIECSATSTLVLKVNSVSAQTIPPLQQCDTGADGFAQFDLNGADVVTTPQESVAFYVSSHDALLQQNPIVNTANYTNATAYHDSVFVRIDDSVNGCSGISDIQLTVNQLPEVVTTGEAFICINQSGATVPIDAGPLPSGSFGYVWAYNNTVLPQTTYAINADQPGAYTVSVTNAGGCSTTRTIAVFATDVPSIASVTADGYSATLNLGVANNGQIGFSIDQPSGPFQSSNYFTGLACGPHTAYVDAGNGCGTTAFGFEITGIPAYFSPNGDGFADYWNIWCGHYYPNTTLYVFDRFGKLLKQFGAASLGWDGTYNGQPVPSDDYWFIMDDGNHTTKGHFSLKR